MQKRSFSAGGLFRGKYWRFPYLGWYLTGKKNLKVGGKT
jgi:hypothetical protein